MRRRVRSRVLTSARTAMRNFDLQLAIATLRLPAQLHVEIGTNPNASGSVWRQQGGPFCGSRPRQVEGRSEQIHRRDAVGMIIEKCFPTLGRRASTPGHILGHARLPDIDAELEKLAVDPWRSPQRIGNAHLAD